MVETEKERRAPNSGIKILCCDHGEAMEVSRKSTHTYAERDRVLDVWIQIHTYTHVYASIFKSIYFPIYIAIM